MARQADAECDHCGVATEDKCGDAQAEEGEPTALGADGTEGQQKAPMIEPTKPMFARITGVRTAECQAGFGVSDAVHAGGSGHAPATITSRSESASTPAVTHRNRTVASGMGGVAAGVTGSLDIQVLSAASRSPLRPERRASYT